MSAFDLTSFYPAVPDSSNYAECCIVALDGVTYLAAMHYSRSGVYIQYYKGALLVPSSTCSIYVLEGNAWCSTNLSSLSFNFDDILYSSVTDTFNSWSSVTRPGDLLNNSSATIVPYDAFASGSVISSTGNAFDSIAGVSAFAEIVGVLPVLMVVLVGYIGIRKGVSFVRSKLQGA